MTLSKEYKVRPSYKDGQETLRIFLSSAFFDLHKVKSGDICNILTSEGLVGPVIAWISKEKIAADVVQTSKSLQKAYGLGLGSRVFITPSQESPVTPAGNVTLRAVASDGVDVSLAVEDECEHAYWTYLLKYKLALMGILTPGLVIEDNGQEIGQKRSFQIHCIDSSDTRGLFRFQSDTRVLIGDPTQENHETQPLCVSDDGLGGLREQIDQINDRLASCDRLTQFSILRPGLTRGNGILLHGAQGTGKTLLLSKISDAAWRGVFHVQKKDLSNGIKVSKATLEQIFTDALKCQPSAIVIDNLDAVATKTDDEHSDMSEFLAEQIDRLRESRTFAIAATRYLADMHQSLRTPKRFLTKIELPVPDSQARIEILKTLTGTARDLDDQSLKEIAACTHGYTGADLEEVLIETQEALNIKYRSQPNIGKDRETAFTTEMMDVLKQTLLHVRPSAMREIFVETPDVRWEDIGGSHEAKKVLQRAIDWPSKVCQSVFVDFE